MRKTLHSQWKQLGLLPGALTALNANTVGLELPSGLAAYANS